MNKVIKVTMGETPMVEDVQEEDEEEAAPYYNPTSRLHKYTCGCASHVINEKTGATRTGPYVVRMAGTGALMTCFYCGEFFRLADEAPTKRFRRHTCGHSDAECERITGADGAVVLRCPCGKLRDEADGE